MRRIALTGTPLQNNLLEYYTMISWVQPGFMGGQGEFKSEFVEPIERGAHMCWRLSTRLSKLGR